MAAEAKSASPQIPVSEISAVCRRRAPEWGKRAIIVGDGDTALTWATELGRRAMDVEVISFSEDRSRKADADLVIQSRAHVAVITGGNSISIANAIVDAAPEIGLVATGHEAEMIEDVQIIASSALPADLMVAVRQALTVGRLRGELSQLRRDSSRQQHELEDLNANLRITLGRRHQAVCDSKSAWERTFDAVPSPIAIVDGSLVVINANRAYAATGGEVISQVPGQKCHEAIFGRRVPCEGCPVLSGDSRAEVTTPDGNSFEVRATVLSEEAGTFVCTYRDLTEDNAKMSDALREERMAALGEMSAGVAHELNNPIGGILALTQALTREENLDPELAEDLRDIEEAAQRSKRILAALLRYARGSYDDPETSVVVEDAVRDALLVTQADLRAERVHVEVTVEPDISPVVSRQSSLQEALVHLLRNAAHALAENDDSKVQRAIVIRVLSEADEVWVEVADNGPGLPAGKTDSLLVPFVSDDKRAAGKGFGLALVSRLIENGSGRVDLVSRKRGGGATVRLRLKKWTDPRSVR